MFNKEGVFLVMVQIIISILSLNIKENGELNQIGKSEAHRAPQLLRVQRGRAQQASQRLA